MNRKSRFKAKGSKGKTETSPVSSSTTATFETPWKSDNSVPKFEDPTASLMNRLTLKDGSIPSLLDLCTNYFAKYVFGWIRMSKIYEKTYPNLPPLEFQLKKIKKTNSDVKDLLLRCLAKKHMLTDEHVMVFIDNVLDMLRLEYPDVSVSGFTAVAELCVSLKVLSIRETVNFTDAVLILFCDRNPHLQDVFLQSTSVTSKGISHLLETCTELKSLSLRFNTSLQTIAMEKSFTNLRSFELFSPGALVPDQTTIHCTNLEQLIFSGTRTSLNVTPRAVGSIIAPLKCLAVRNAMLPSDYLSAILSESFAPTLTVLDLSYCKTVADWPLVLKNQLSKFTSLKELRLTGVSIPGNATPFSILKEALSKVKIEYDRD